jgi:hypothetical protein
MTPLCELVPLADDPTKGELKFNFHPGQLRAWDSEKRFILVLAGTQGGKTSFGPVWLWREIMHRGPGDYMVVTPTYPLLMKKALPEFLRLFKKQLHLGEFQQQQKVFTFSEDKNVAMHGAAGVETATQVFFGHAQDPESLESATAKAMWLDEAGQKKFRLGSWEALQRRLSIHEGRALLTTTPYDLGWLKQQLWDPWIEAKRDHPLIDVIRFDSIENPAFPRREFERARKALPRWKFDLFYRAIFTRPASLIYGSFDETRHKMPRFSIPPEWPRFVGLDFGGVNTAAIYYAEERTTDGKPGPIVDGHVTSGTRPTGRLIAYREYLAGERSAAEHCYHLMRGDALNPPEPRIPTCAGGSASEGQWRREFAAGGIVKGVRVPGLPIHGAEAIRGPVTVEVGIEKVFAAHTRDEIIVFDDLKRYLDEKLSYSRELDEQGEPTQKIDSKESFHVMDSERYIITYMKLGRPKPTSRGTSVAHPGFQF